MQKVRVTICGRGFNLCTEENPEYLTKLAAELDGKISRFMEENPGTSAMSAAIMVALSMSDAASKNEGDADNLRTQIKEYAEEANTARVNADKLGRAMEALLQENRKLKSDLELLTLRNQVEQESAQSSKK